MNSFFDPFLDNEKALKKFLTKSEIISLNNELTSDQMMFYNQKLVNYLYSIKEINDLQKLDKRLDKCLKNINKIRIKSDIKNYAIVVVKPEMLPFENQLIDFLTKKQFKIKANISKAITKKQFMLMYKKQIFLSGSIFDLPSRMLNLINKQIHILVVYKQRETACADELNQLKGRLGVIDPNTIRGIGANCINWVIKNASKMELNCIDPIQMFRGIIKYDFGKDPSVFKNLENPMLFFFANCVHIPEYNELSEHIKILLSKKEIQLYINNNL